MQTPAEKFLISRAISFLKNKSKQDKKAEVINFGAGKSLVLEEEISQQTDHWVIDRIDIDLHKVNHRLVRNCWFGDVCQTNQQVQSGKYDLAIANYLLEHVVDLKKASSEMSRSLKKGALLMLTVPNPEAPEFKIAKKMPLWFHQLFRGNKNEQEAYHTYYAFSTIQQLIEVFEEAGFCQQEVVYYPLVSAYLYRFPVINLLGKIYDSFVLASGCRRLMGNVGIVLVKTK